MLRAHLLLAALTLHSACTDRSDSSPTAATTSGDSTGAPTTTGGSSTGLTSTPTTTASTTGTTSTCEDYVFSPDFPLQSLAMTLMLDRSPAMLDPWDHDGDPQTPEQPRWASVRSALLTVLPKMQPPSYEFNFGLASFPTADVKDTDDAAACAVNPDLLVPVSDTPPLELLAGLPPATPPPGSFIGGAPIRAALTAAVAQPDPTNSRNRTIVLLTNSAANCDPNAIGPAALLETHDEGAAQAAVSAIDAGIRVFVFGIGAATTPSPILVDHRPDGVIVSDTLAELANNGGGAYVNVGSEADLLLGLSKLFETPVISCQLEVSPEPGPDQAITGVRVDGMDFAEVADCAADGWRVSGSEIELCGAACTQFQATLDLEVSVTCI